MSKSLHPTKMRHQADVVRRHYHVEVDPGTTIDDVQVPSFWKHYVNAVDAGTLIDIIGEGFDIQLRVTGKGIGYVETRLLRKWVSEAPAHKLSKEETDALAASIPDGYIVDHTPMTKWRVKLVDGGVEVLRGKATKAEAIEAAIMHAAKAAGLAA